MEGLILKDDARYIHTENFLLERGHILNKPEASAENLGFVIFPFAQGIDMALYNDSFFSSLGKGTLIFSGIRNPYLSKKCAENKLEYYVIMEDPGTQIKNAVPTSEGVIAYLISNRADTIAGSGILIIGYGICGSDLAARLRCLGACVYALVRNREKECAARSGSITPVYLSELDTLNFDVIINTVPGRVLTDEMLLQTHGALLIDIASKPYGFDMELAKKLNEKSALLPGIPGKYAIKTAGEILGEFISAILDGRGNK